MIFRRWATHGLRTGDLTALFTLAQAGAQPNDGCAERLERRGFIRRDANGQVTLTLRGRLAVMIRRSMT